MDTLGAGDAFCSVASLAAVRGLPMELATFMGQLAGAQAVRIVGQFRAHPQNQISQGRELDARILETLIPCTYSSLAPAVTWATLLTQSLLERGHKVVSRVDTMWFGNYLPPQPESHFLI